MTLCWNPPREYILYGTDSGTFTLVQGKISHIFIIIIIIIVIIIIIIIYYYYVEFLFKELT